MLSKVEAVAGFKLDGKKGSLFREENTSVETEMEIFEAWQMENASWEIKLKLVGIVSHLSIVEYR